MVNKENLPTNQIMLSTEMFNEISVVLKDLEVSIRAELAIFCETSGIPITSAGNQRSINIPSLSTLAAANFAATAEMARLLGEKDGFRFLFLEGERYNIYLCNVGYDYLLTIAISKSIALGMLRIYANRAVKQLTEILNKARKQEKASERIFDSEFSDLLGNAFDASFKKE